ncbi:response regulator [Campylobacter sp. 19-13652]|uniref:response regulator n=1 Tax=Campylobacter sp. 19-13652 TaxID=2840180 RepID=UPI001C74D199|nr:response regulator [Campylobacter sp. 19-13652]BCX79303.1 hypothetical protein LBC_07650 [Campylobacter sp. 19-13652]
MKIDSKTLGSVLSEAAKYTRKLSANSDEFKSLLNSQSEPNADASLNQMSVEDFKAALKKYGAFGFVAKMSEDIIGEKLAKKRAELEESMGLNDESKSAEERLELKATIDDLVRDYEKELRASLKQNAILQKQQQLEANKSSHGLEMALAEL